MSSGEQAGLVRVGDGTLQLDEPVDRLMPELADRKVLRQLDSALEDTVPANRVITVRDLLTFRMGTGIVFAPPGTYPIQVAMEELELGQGPPQPSVPPEPDEWIRRLGTLPLVHQPGERWMYNTGADVLGVLIARSSGRPFEAFLRERLFDPLGMRDTGFGVPEGRLDRLPPGFWTSVITGRDDVGRRPGTFGWDGGLGTVWYSDPEADLVTILMTQRAWESPIPPAVCVDFWTSAYAAIED